MMKFPMVMVIGLLLLVAVTATAEPDPRLFQVREALKKHRTLTKRQLLWISKHARTNLVNLATDRKETNLIRVRAIRALGLFADKGTFRVLRAMVFDPVEPREIRAASMEALGVFRDPGVVGILKQFLLSETPEFRLNAARGLAKNGSKDACSAILQALAKERILDLKLKLDALSQACLKHKGGEQ